MLTLYQNGQPIEFHEGHHGTDELPTPLIASMMYYITYNPLLARARSSRAQDHCAQLLGKA